MIDKVFDENPPYTLEQLMAVLHGAIQSGKVSKEADVCFHDGDNVFPLNLVLYCDGLDENGVTDTAILSSQVLHPDIPPDLTED